MNYLVLIATAIVVLLSPTSALAQFDMSAINQANFNSAIINVRYVSNMDAINASESESTPVEQDAGDALSYNASPKVRQHVYNGVVKTTRRTDPALADRLAVFFSSVDVVGEMEKVMEPVGLRTNNVGDAYTLSLIWGWQAANGYDLRLDSATVAAVRSQIHEIMLSNSNMKLSDANVKQAMGDIQIVQAALLAVSLQQMKENAAGKA